MDDTTVPTGAADDHAAAVAALAARLRHEHLEILPFFHDLRNQIVHPLNLHVETRYFFRKWKSDLGPVLALLIMELRDRCYYNPRTGERRDYCWPSQEELARAIGVSVRTVIRALQDPRAGAFIRVQHRYRYDSALGKKVRTSSAYVVAMDDPLRPEDEAALTRLAAERLLAEETTQRDQLLATPTADLPARLADSSAAKPAPGFTDKFATRTGAGLTDNLSLINKADNLAEEEVLTGRDPHEKKEHGSSARSLAGATTRDGTPDPADEPPASVVAAYAAANDRRATPLEKQRLAALVQRFDLLARQATPPSTGAEWVVSAIIEAVDSGSAFVAPRRIATICERWARGSPPRGAARRSESARKRSPDIAVRQSASDASAQSNEDERPVIGQPAIEEVPVDPFADSREAVTPTFVVSTTRPITNWQLWRLVTDELARQTVGKRHRTWLDQASLIGQEADALVIGAPGRFARDLLERQFAEPMARAIADILGERYRLSFVVSRTWLTERQGPAAEAELPEH